MVERENVSTVCVLWARMKEDRYPTQFVTAFPEGLVESWSELYWEQRAEAERVFRDFGDEDEVAGFFTTYVQIPRPSQVQVEGAVQ